jgi:alanine-glyoxylate transaminase/serine-glyoxylate transaminase/serine-pyruvate transaminase
MSRPTIDHRGPEFQELSLQLLEDMKWVFRTEHPVFIYPASGSGAWEAAIVNTLSPGDRVLVFNQGFFAQNWTKVAERFGLRVQVETWEARRGLAADAVVDALRLDEAQEIKAVLVVHNETSTGVTSNLQVIGKAMRESGHPALLFVDAVSSLAVSELRHDDWSIDVSLSGSQKGLMLPPGLSFLAVSPRALAAGKTATLPRSYWSWDEQLEFNGRGFYPYTPATNLLYGLSEAISMLREEGLENVFKRHNWFGEATRTAVTAWGLETYAADPHEASGGVTAVLLPDGHDADVVRGLVLDRFDMALGTGLGDVKGRVFRIGHMGDLSVLSLLGTLAGVEMGLALSGVPHQQGGVAAAMEYLTTEGGAG